MSFMDKKKEKPIMMMSPIAACCLQNLQRQIGLLALLVWLLKRWNHQVERIGWEIWMMIMMMIHSFHNDEKKSRSSSIFSILHNQTPQHTRFQFLIAMKISPCQEYTDKYSCFINFTNQESSIHPSIHNLSTCDKHWVLDLVAHSYYLKAWVWWYLQLFIYLFIIILFIYFNFVM